MVEGAVRRISMGRVIGLVVLVLAVLAGGWWVFVRDPARGADAAHQRAIYAHFGTFPGATSVSDEVYEFRADGRGLGSYGVRRTYRVPASTRAADVLAFYRQQIPPAWSEASDSLCSAALAVLPSPPTLPQSTGTPTTVPASVLMYRRSQMTILTSHDGVKVNGRYDGFTLGLSVESSSKVVTLDNVYFSCGSDTADTAADQFDSP